MRDLLSAVELFDARAAVGLESRGLVEASRASVRFEDPQGDRASRHGVKLVDGSFEQASTDALARGGGRDVERKDVSVQPARGRHLRTE